MSQFKTWIGIGLEVPRTKKVKLSEILQAMESEEAATVSIAFLADSEWFIIIVENDDPISDRLYDIKDLGLYMGVIGPSLEGRQMIPLAEFVDFDPATANK